ncbi:MAG: hypothetical protein ACJA1B_002613 [Polaribacter sp.]|jgi:hypothetical protein
MKKVIHYTSVKILINKVLPVTGAREQIASSNATRNFVGAYHKIKAKYPQLYLNEFIYKLNRRYFGTKIFDRLFIASIIAIGK